MHSSRPNGACPRQRLPLGERPQMGVMQVVAHASIQKNKPLGWRQASVLCCPARPRFGYVIAFLRTGMQRLYLSVSPNRANVFPMVVGPTAMPCSALTHWHSCASVCSGANATWASSGSFSVARRSGTWRHLCARAGLAEPASARSQYAGRAHTEALSNFPKQPSRCGQDSIP